MTPYKKFGISFLSLLLLCCGSDDSTNVSVPQSTNKTCIENVITTINGENFICKNDELIPQSNTISSNSESIANSSSNISGFTPSSSSEESVISSDSPNVGGFCQYIGEWRNYGNDDKIICLDNVWKLQSEITASYATSSSSSKVDSLARIDPKTVTFGTITDNRDNRIYKTVEIGNQTWMAENLRFQDNLTSPSIFCYDNDESLCEKQGVYYTWVAAMKLDSKKQNEKFDIDSLTRATHQGVCPSGWHISTLHDWKILSENIGGIINKYGNSYDEIGSDLMADTLWYDEHEDVWAKAGKDTYGLNILPYGYCSYTSCNRKYENATFWTSSEPESSGQESQAQTISFSIFASSANDFAVSYTLGLEQKFFAFQIRCVKN